MEAISNGFLNPQHCDVEREVPTNWSPPFRPVSSSSDNPIGKLLNDFQPISLEQTNEKAQMLSRLDNKYVVNFDEFSSFAEAVKGDFSILEIEDKRQFTYRSCYYDDEFRCYLEHHQGRRQRCKVRTREYVDGGGMRFFEVKLKGVRGLTAKHRIKSDFVIAPKIEGDYLDMLRSLYRKQYKKEMPFELRPSLIIGYKRCTLVALHGGERVTVDHQLSFADPTDEMNQVRIGDGFMIVETKSADGKGTSDQGMKKLKVRKASACSKYCIGANLIGGVVKNNNFRETLRTVHRNIVSNNTVPNFLSSKAPPVPAAEVVA